MTNADIYFASANFAMAKHPEHVKLYVESFKKYLSQTGAESKSYDQQIDIVLSNVRQQVQQSAKNGPDEGWALNDYDSITWFLGMFAKGMVDYLYSHGFPSSFEEIFIDSFNKHFISYDMA